ncbi:MAG: phosphatidate cytidylyltransferase [Candidatus Omnitrophica bacterium]|nr:phosphatidate cytidylyltransferase [Candidatus Omnitrophota bacterium]
MRQLGKRLISSAVLVSLSIYAMWGPLWFFFLASELLIFFALREYYRLAATAGAPIETKVGIVAGLLAPIALFYSVDLVFLVFATMMIFLAYFRRERREHGLLGVALTFFGVFYVSWFFSHVILIRALTHGSEWVFYVVLLVKGGDAAAYFIGKKFGKTRLIEYISPNKSVEGAIAGFAATLLLSFISSTYLPQVHWMHLLVLGLVIGVLAPLSDLAESLIKRNAQIKDSGEVPGLGGILDVLDSLLLTVPFVYFYLVSIMGLR